MSGPRSRTAFRFMLLRVLALGLGVWLGVWLSGAPQRAGASPPIRELTVSIAELPVLAPTPDQGVLIDLVRAIDTVEGTHTRIIVAPFARSLRNVQMGLADYHLPLINLPLIDHPGAAPPLEKIRLAHPAQFTVPFVIYSRADAPMTTTDLERVTVGTKLPHASLFPFKTTEVECLPCALRMVQEKRLDAFIFAKTETDAQIRALGLQGQFHTSPYALFPVHAVVADSPRGREVEALLADAFSKLRQSGQLAALTAAVEQSFTGAAKVSIAGMPPH